LGAPASLVVRLVLEWVPSWLSPGYFRASRLRRSCSTWSSCGWLGLVTCKFRPRPGWPSAPRVYFFGLLCCVLAAWNMMACAISSSSGRHVGRKSHAYRPWPESPGYQDSCKSHMPRVIGKAAHRKDHACQESHAEWKDYITRRPARRKRAGSNGQGGYVRNQEMGCW
jgi:hypothetical protein